MTRFTPEECVDLFKLQRLFFLEFSQQRVSTGLTTKSTQFPNRCLIEMIIEFQTPTSMKFTCHMRYFILLAEKYCVVPAKIQHSPHLPFQMAVVA